MSSVHCFRDLGVPRVWDWFRGGSFGLISDKGCFICVVIRTLERLGVEDRARDFVASKTSELNGMKTAPECMIVMGLSAPESCIVSMLVLRQGTCKSGLRVPYMILAHGARIGHWEPETTG